MDTSTAQLKTFSSYWNLELESCPYQFAIEHESIVLNSFSSVPTLLPKLNAAIFLRLIQWRIRFLALCGFLASKRQVIGISRLGYNNQQWNLFALTDVDLTLYYYAVSTICFVLWYREYWNVNNKTIHIPEQTSVRVTSELSREELDSWSEQVGNKNSLLQRETQRH